MNDLTQIFKLLSDESRLRVIMLLSREELCVCELCGVLDMPQPKISKILSKLRDLGLVGDRRREKFVFYTLHSNNALLNHVLSFMEGAAERYPLLNEDLQRLADKDRYIDKCALEALRAKN